MGGAVDLNYDEIHRAISAIAPTGVFEVRLLGTRSRQIDSGYFDSAANAANAVVSAQGYYKGMYLTPNPVNPVLLARSANRITPWSENTTLDPDIVRRRWLLVDVDPIRPSGISSSEPEHSAAIARGYLIRDTLGAMYGFPEPMIVDSGNGCHLLYRIDEENSGIVRDEIQTALHALKAIFNDKVCDVDTTVFNAARIWRIPGTWARKGDSTPDRPHRRSRVLQYADPFGKLSLVQVLRFNGYNSQLIKSLKPVTRSTGELKHEYPADEKLYRRLNEYAMHSLKSWVTHFFPAAREYKEGYRVASADIGQPYEEDLTIHPYPLGIKYFGVSDQGDTTEGRRTPVSVIAEYSLQSDKATAAQALSTHLNFPITEFLPATPISPPAQSAGNSGGMAGLLGQVPVTRYDFSNIRTVHDLQRKPFEHIKWVIQGVLPVGNMLLAARPKMRKTWLALQLSMAIAGGRQFLDWPCIQGDVLFLGLEDNERRLQNRIRTLQMFDIVPPDLNGFRYWTGGMGYDGAGRLIVTNPEEAQRTLEMFPRGDAGVDALEQYLEAFPKTSTIIIDTLAHFRGPRMSRDVYQADYESMMPLTKLASRKGVLIIPVHHEKKGNADRGIGADFLEDVSGSAGITGGADGVISIKGRRGVQEDNESRNILISGRDVPFDYSIDAQFDAERGGWLKSSRADTRVTVKALLQQHPFLNQKDLQALIPNISQSRLYRVLTEMKMEGEIEQGRYGYALRRN